VTTGGTRAAVAVGRKPLSSPDGLVLTNNHVIEDSTKITGTVAATGKTYPAALIGYVKLTRAAPPRPRPCTA
jgi:S1-C subfamily serine protease